MSARIFAPAPKSFTSEAAVGPRPRLTSESAPARETPDLDAQLERAERFGHSFDRMPATAPRPEAAPIQRVIYSHKSKTPEKAYKDIGRTNWYKDDLDDAGRAWAHDLHGKSDEHYTVDELHKKIAERKGSGDPTPALPQKLTGKKRKRVTPLVPRQTGPAVGKQVDYLKDPKLRTERRAIRELEKVGKSPGDKNLYTKRYKPPGEKPFKLLTSSIPPSSLPADYQDRPLDELVDSRLGATLHSEGVTDKIEQNYPPFKKKKIEQHEHYSASSREQCETCRYHYPPQKPGAHAFGSLYSGTTDHIEDADLRKKLIQNKGIIGELDLTKEEREKVGEARTDASAARQNDPHQNPLLSKKRKSLGSKHSDGEQSSDDDDLYVTPDLYWGSSKGYGKGNVHVIKRRQYTPKKEIEEETEKTRKLVEEKKKGASKDLSIVANDEEEEASGEEEG